MLKAIQKLKIIHIKIIFFFRGMLKNSVEIIILMFTMKCKAIKVVELIMMNINVYNMKK